MSTGSFNARCLQSPTLQEVAAQLESGSFFWADFDKLDGADLVALADLLKLHPLTVEDAQSFKKRPKFEEFDGYAFMVVYGVDAGAGAGTPLLREVHLVISGAYLLTIHREPIAALKEVRHWIEQEALRSEQLLIHRILDELTTTFFPVLARIDDDIDEIEDNVIADASEASLQRIFSLKRDLVALRRVVTPLRDMFARSVERISELPGIEPDDRLYFRDLYDTMIRVSDMVDSYRDLLSGATDLYLSTIANRQGEVNKQLTVIATIFLPLTFLTGFFGQNFATLVRAIQPTWTFYAFGVGGLVAASCVFLWWFKRKQWI